MTLHAWQCALLQALPDPVQIPRILMEQKERLTRREINNLATLRASTGFDVTRDVQIWWRRARLQIALPFSMQLIQRLQQDYLIEQYQKLPCTTLFFLREAQEFNRFIQKVPHVPVLVRDMAIFECMLHQAHLKKSSTDETSYSTELRLSSCPETCIAALLKDEPLPEPVPGGVAIHINSEWPRVWRLKN